MLQVRPISPQERIEVIDVLRGFAIFGILLVNMAYFNSPALYMSGCDLELWPGELDRAVSIFIQFAAENKFYSLFSFLFGLGMTIQLERVEARGVRFGPLYSRRMGILLAIGLGHAYGLWMGDILRVYAVLGFFLLVFRKRSPVTLIVWAAILLAIPPMLILASLGMMAMVQAVAPLIPQAAIEIERGLAREVAWNEVMSLQSLQVYAEGSFTEIMGQRALDVERMHIALLIVWPNIFAMFLLGVYAGGRRIFQNVSMHLPFIRKVMWWGLVWGVVGSFFYVLGYRDLARNVPSLAAMLSVVSFAFGPAALCLLYASGIVLLMQRDSWRRILAPLAAVGRLALSNYLLQTLICTTIFYSYGFGLYGKVGPALGVLLTIGIYISQILLSKWWLRRLQLGPMEWLWRWATYRSYQPMRK